MYGVGHRLELESSNECKLEYLCRHDFSTFSLLATSRSLGGTFFRSGLRSLSSGFRSRSGKSIKEALALQDLFAQVIRNAWREFVGKIFFIFISLVRRRIHGGTVFIFEASCNLVKARHKATVYGATQRVFRARRLIHCAAFRENNASTSSILLTRYKLVHTFMGSSCLLGLGSGFRLARVCVQMH